MAGVFRKKNTLRCFYCGRRSDLLFHGQRSFECKNCDATNWLDKDGSITDPPISDTPLDDTAQPAGRPSYAVSKRRRPSSPRPSIDTFRTSDSIFCARCQANQEHLTRALKEFELPDDTTDPGYAARMRSYRQWKSDLEHRYPQMCRECEPKVQMQLQKTSYMARSDHLRRVNDRTRAQRQEPRRLETLDYVDTIGKWSWQVAFVLQFGWQFLVLSTLFVNYTGETEMHGVLLMLRKLCNYGTERSPQPERLIRWAINMSLVSFPWNPRFKQSIRGFTSHIVGLRQWYSYQFLSILIRCGCLFLSQYDTAGKIPLTNLLGAHLVIASLVLYIHKVSPKSIRTDTTPLFGLYRAPQASSENTQDGTRDTAQIGAHGDLSNILDEIMSASPSRNGNPVASLLSDASPDRSPARGPSFSSGTSHNGSFGAHMRQNLPRVSHASSDALQRPQNVLDSDDMGGTEYEEMDWSPSGSQHRAFSTHNPFKVKNPNPRFNDTPIEPKAGPFWYKVPPAPTNPAQMVRNPPMKPIIRESPKERQGSMFSSSRPDRIDMGNSSQKSGSDVIFKDPQFFAPAQKDDPRDGLSNMMGSFSISPSPDDKTTRISRSRSTAAGAPFELHNNSKVRTAELIVLFGALWAWVTALASQEDYGPTMGLGAVCACLIVSIRLGADLLVDAQIREGQEPSIFRLSWANLGMAQVIAALALLWRVWSESSETLSCGIYGNTLFGIMIAHQIWHIFS